MNKEDGLSNKLWLEESNISEIKKSYLSSYVSIKQQIEIKLHKSIEQFLKKNRITWQSLITTAWGLLLSRLSSSENYLIGVGNLYSSRLGSIKVEPLLHPIKIQISKDIFIKQSLAKVKMQLEKKPVQFDKLNFKYLILFDAKKNQKNKLEQLNSDIIPLILSTQKNQYVFTIFYNNHAFSKKNIIRIIAYLKTLLHDICTNENKKTFGLNIIPIKEKNKILTTWAKPTYDFHIPQFNKCIHDLITQFALDSPLSQAIVHNTRVISYKELNEQSTFLAKKLINVGVKKGDHVCVLIQRSPDLLIGMLAIFKCGGVYVPINPKYPDEKIEYVLEDSQAKILLTDSLEKIPEKYHARAILITGISTKENFSTINLPTVTPEDMAYIIYTSGTTGKPKGVLIKHKSLINFSAWYRGCFLISHHDRASQCASQAFDSYFCETIPILANGGSVYIVDDNIKLTPALFFDFLQKNKITICDLPTAYAQMLFSLEWPKQLSLRHVKIGGEALIRYPKQNFNFDIWNIYGPTETTIESIYKKIFFAGENANAKNKPLLPPIGKPLVNCEAYIVDQFMQPVPIGVAGELLIGGVNVSPGYFNRPELTEEKFIPNIFNQATTEKLYKTGDQVKWLDNGDIEFIGRADNQIKIRGYRIELNEIENVIRQHPDVRETIVVAKDTQNHDKTLIAYVVPDLDKDRFIYQDRCLISVEKEKHIEAITENISKHGVAIAGITEKFRPGQKVQLYLKLPGFNERKNLNGIVIWQQEDRCGIIFNLADDEKKMVEKSIDYYLSTLNVMELILTSSAKRSLKKALHKKLPDYMIPATFIKILSFPLTFSGKIDTKALPPPQEFEQILRKEYIEPKTTTEKKLTKIWEDILHQENISMADNFFEIGGSSLTVAELSVNILKKFNISIPAKLLFDLSYIPILAEYIDSKGESYTSQSSIQEDIDRDSILHENIIPTGKLSLNINNPQHILLTGAGGFLGIYLLRELLKKTTAKIYCIIRKGSFETPAKRFMLNIEKFGLSNEISLSDRRIVIIAGDISEEYFGLPLEQYNYLLDKIDLIFHCGAQVNIMASYNKLRGSNVNGTLEIIKFATKVKDKPIQYISTLSSAYRKDENGRLTEEFPNESYNEIFGGYAISKWVSERLLTQIKNRGLPVTIYRSGYIFGQSDTGMTSLNDALLMLIKGCIQMGLAPIMDEKITILPVDFVSQLITSISLKFPEVTEVYHVDHPTGILWSELVTWLKNYGYIIKMIPMKEWQHELSQISQDNTLFAFLPYYLALPEDYHSPDVINHNAAALLPTLNLHYPAIDDKLLKRYMEFLCQTGFLPLPESYTVKS